MKHTLLLASLALVVWTLPGQAEDKRADNQRGADERRETGRPLTDEDFVRHAAISDMAEVMLGRVATENAANPQVEEFGRRMVEDHSKALKEVSMLADKKGLKLMQELDEKHKMMVNKLSSLKGEQFDREYMAHMVKGHKMAVEMFENQARQGRDDALRSYAAKSIPTLKKHLEMAQQLAGDRQATGTDKPRPGGNNPNPDK